MKVAVLAVAALAACATVVAGAADSHAEFALADVLAKKLGHHKHANATSGAGASAVGVKWIHFPRPGGPSSARPVDWANIKYLDRTVATVDWAGAHTPTDVGLRPGHSSAAGETGKAYGTSGVSYADSRFGTEYWAAARPVGKLLFNIGSDTYGCTATLIGKSLLVTAAHCVYAYGTNTQAGWYTNFRFYPQKMGSSVPFGYWTGQAAMVLNPYYAGTDTCKTRGISCNNDIALIWLSASGSSDSRQAGTALGYFGYGWNGYSFSTPSSSTATNPSASSVFGTTPFVAITQLGYPGAYDQGQSMQINNAPGFKYATTSTLNGRELRNLAIGTGMGPGSSGGPWIANFGVNAAISGTDQSGQTYVRGSASDRNTIVAVASWGWTDNRRKFQFASWFGKNNEFPNDAYGTRGAGNVGKIMYDACDNSAVSGWQLQSKGFCR